MKWLITSALVLLALPAYSQNLEQYQPLEAGVCHDVNLRCIKAILKNTDFFYMVFSNEGELVAITQMKPDGTETVIWGELRLPLKPNEHEL